MWIVSFIVLGMVSAQDPSNSWLSYAAATGGSSAKITALNTTWKVPQDPVQKSGSNAPGWWFGVQTANGRGALIQPILAWADGSPQWTIFNGVFDWNDQSWHQSRQIVVSPGDTITSSVIYDASGKRFVMWIASKESGKSVTTPYKEHAGQIESVAYFVLEHAPNSCKAYPPDGELTFTNIVMEVDGKVITPKWEAKQQRPACSSEAMIVSSSEIKFTWSAHSNNSTSATYVGKDHPSFPRFRSHWSTS